ncbi:MAG: SGNH/GDSL hydrolase family protein [Rubrivivax sp.]
MPSVSIYASEFNRHLEQGMAVEQFRYRFLAEGDSWMERSSLLSPSLPDHLAREMDTNQEPTLIINLARFGDTMRRMGEMADREFAFWVRQFAYDAVLLSAGGNDFIDAARDPDPGQGILRDMNGQPAPASGRDCLRPEAVDLLVQTYLNPNFERLYRVLRADAGNAGTPLFLNCYDTPVARNAPTPPFTRAWLYVAYRKNSIAPQLWPDLTAAVFERIQAAIAGWAAGRPGVFLVGTQGVLQPADPNATGSSNDWLNEIHPNAAGWRKLAAVWRSAIRPLLP